jgi:glycosyltransferase involved in cell wall biosynthesis
LRRTLLQINLRAAGFANLRLAVVSPFVDRNHGTERALAELLERLTRDYGFEIHLYSQRVEDLRLDNANLKRLPQSGAIFWRKVPSIPGPYLFQFCGWLVLNKLWRLWDRLVRRVRCDLLFSPGINCFDADVILVHAIFHRLAEMAELSQDSGLRGAHRKAYYRLLCLLERKIYRNRRVVLAAVSKHSANQLGQYFSRDGVLIVPNGVDTKVFNPVARDAQRDAIRKRWNISPNERALLLVGNDWKTKGLPVLLQAAAKCHDLPLRLLVVGKEDPAGWAGLISRLNLAERVSFFAPVADVLDFYAAADVYVAPSLEDSFNLPALEAMACGMAAIVSSSAGVSEWIQSGVDGLILKDPRDAEELAGALRSLLLDPGSMQRMGKNAARTAATLTWDRHADAMHSVFLNARASDV